jgi:hypothetical protein
MKLERLSNGFGVNKDEVLADIPHSERVFSMTGKSKMRLSDMKITQSILNMDLDQLPSMMIESNF